MRNADSIKNGVAVVGRNRDRIVAIGDRLAVRQWWHQYRSERRALPFYEQPVYKALQKDPIYQHEYFRI